jgi:hypothetical protein
LNFIAECPGLDSGWSDSGIEVKNPLFNEETPATVKTEKSQATSKSTPKK